MDDGEDFGLATAMIVFLVVVVSLVGWLCYNMGKNSQNKPCDQYTVWQYKQKVVPQRCEGANK